MIQLDRTIVLSVALFVVSLLLLQSIKMRDEEQAVLRRLVMAASQQQQCEGRP